MFFLRYVDMVFLNNIFYVCKRYLLFLLINLNCCFGIFLFFYIIDIYLLLFIFCYFLFFMYFIVDLFYKNFMVDEICIFE